MSPDERQLLVDLFDRIRQNANNPRDREAEAFIADQVRKQPYAAYLLAQTVIVQDQALRAANERLQQLEQRVQELEGQGTQQQGSGGFLGGLGSLFGGGDRGPPQSSVPPSRWGGPQGGAPAYGQGGYVPPQGGYAPAQGGPWTGAPQYQQGGGGGFLKGALGAAAGVAGGVLLADSIRGLFHGAGNPFGIGSGFGGGGGAGLGGFGGGDTVVNNYYEGGDSATHQAAEFGPDQGPEDAPDVLDAGSGDDLSGGNDSFDV
jgi:hypothetical protein